MAANPSSAPARTYRRSPRDLWLDDVRLGQLRLQHHRRHRLPRSLSHQHHRRRRGRDRRVTCTWAGAHQVRFLLHLLRLGLGAAAGHLSADPGRAGRLLAPAQAADASSSARWARLSTLAMFFIRPGGYLAGAGCCSSWPTWPSAPASSSTTPTCPTSPVRGPARPRLGGRLCPGLPGRRPAPAPQPGHVPVQRSAWALPRARWRASAWPPPGCGGSASR